MSHQDSKKGNTQNIVDDYKYGFSKPEESVFKTEKGLDEEKIRQISKIKNEPGWMLDYRLKAYKIFIDKKMPDWGADLSGIDFENIFYYLKPTSEQKQTWEELPDSIKDTYERLGIPEAERKFLAGVSAQYESEVVYHSLIKELEEQGVVFTDMDTGLREYESIVKKYFGTLISAADNKFSALNTAVWSGGSFVYIPKGIKVKIPLQAYFRINAKNMGQFERTLIIAEEGSDVHYIEGCTAPVYSSDSLHSAVVEIFCKKNSRVRYTTVQNWAPNVYNLVTKRAVAEEGATMEWIDGNIGSKKTMKYPSIILKGKGSKGVVVSAAYAGKDQHQDTGTKIFLLAPNTSAEITAKSVSQYNGKTTYRGIVSVSPNANNAKVSVKCDALLLDEESTTDTIPVNITNTDIVEIEHEASVSKMKEIQLQYLRSRGISEDEANSMVVNGFMDAFTKELPMEYAIELNRLIALNMEGSVG
jgi:Fe-S cluster assembly protein SufB